MSQFRKQSTGSVLWEVLAPFVRWPLYSPKRLGIIVLAVVLAFTACSRRGEPTEVASAPATSAVSAAASATTGMVTTAPAPMPSTTAAPPATTPASLAPTGAVSTTPAVTPGTGTPAAVAEAFVSAWAHRGAPAGAWRQGWQPYVTPAFATALATTDTARIPATERTSAGVVKSSQKGVEMVQVGTDGGDVIVTVTLTGTRWLASHIVPVGVPGLETPVMTPQPTPAAAQATGPAVHAQG